MATDVLKKGVVIVREPGFRLLKTFHDGIHGVTGLLICAKVVVKQSRLT